MTITLRNFCKFFLICSCLSGCLNDDKVDGLRVEILKSERTNAKTNVAIELPKMIDTKIWGGPQKNLKFSPNYFTRDALKKVWSLDLGESRIVTSPVIFNNKIISLDDKGNLRCLDLTTKKVCWIYSVIPYSDTGKAIFGGGLAFDNNNNLYVTTSFGEVLALSIKDGTLTWRFKVDAPILDAPTIVGDNIYITDATSISKSLSRTGKINWSVKGVSTSHIRSNIGSPVEFGETLLLPSSSGILLAVDIANGKKQWSFNFNRYKTGYARNVFGAFNGNPSIFDDIIYFGNVNGQFNALKSNGNVLWQAPFGLEGSPLLVSNSLFLVSDTNSLIRLNKSDGSLIWSRNLGKESQKHRYYGPILIGSKLWVSDSNGQLNSFSPITGQLIDQFFVNSGIAGPPIYYSRKILLYTMSGKLIAFE